MFSNRYNSKTTEAFNVNGKRPCVDQVLPKAFASIDFPNEPQCRNPNFGMVTRNRINVNGLGDVKSFLNRADANLNSSMNLQYKNKQMLCSKYFKNGNDERGSHASRTIQNQSVLSETDFNRTVQTADSGFAFKRPLMNGSKNIGQNVANNANLNVATNQNSKTSPLETFRIFSGTVDRILRWYKMLTNLYYVEVIASVISIQEGNVRLQKKMLLKDKRGPILQVVHYVNDHIDIEDFYVGQMLRCVGHMVGPNILHAVSIRAATPDEVANLQRLCYVCDHAVARAVSI